jgi:hypothetical protein
LSIRFGLDGSSFYEQAAFEPRAICRLASRDCWVKQLRLEFLDRPGNAVGRLLRCRDVDEFNVAWLNHFADEVVVDIYMLSNVRDTRGSEIARLSIGCPRGKQCSGLRQEDRSRFKLVSI